MKILYTLLLLYPILILSQISGNTFNEELWIISQSAPYEMKIVFDKAGLKQNYEINLTHLNPFYYHGDFNGDGLTDYAVLLTNKMDKTNKLAILGGNKKVYWLDKDKDLQYPTLTAWYVHPKNLSVWDSPHEDEKAPDLIGDALMIIKVEASSSLIYWNGKRFVSYWQSD